MEESQERSEELRKLMLLKKMLLRQGMTSEARERLGRVRIANPELAERAESVCIQLIQQGRKIDDEILKRILDKLSPKKEIRIMRW